MFYNMNPQFVPQNNYQGMMQTSAMNFFGGGNGASDWQMSGQQLTSQQNYWNHSHQPGSNPSPNNPQFSGFQNGFNL